MTRAGGLSLRIGLDVGGTNTDAVVLDPDDAVVLWAKRPTTADVSTGIDEVLRDVLDRLGSERSLVRRLVLGTTHATNAVVERRGLARVAVVRLGLPAGASVPPLEESPADLADAVCAGVVQLCGGHLLDGTRLARFDAEGLERFLRSLGERVDAVAVTSVFAPAYPDDEFAAREVVARVLGPNVPVSLSHQIGGLGLVARENATILNSALHPVAFRVAAALEGPVRAHGLRDVATYFAQNDGTLMSVDAAGRRPVLTIGSGPANSVRGAAVLAQCTDAVVVDVGGTTTDVTVLSGGYPRQSTAGVRIGGIALNAPMPDAVSVPVGGGTVLHERAGVVEVGPDSVGADVIRQALVYGGDMATLTDAAVVAGRTQVGTRQPSDDVTTVLLDGLAVADRLIERTLEAILPQTDGVVVLVGGAASILAPDIPGVRRVLRPEFSQVASAVGAAVAHVAGRTERIVAVDHEFAAVRESATRAAIAEAIAAGADPERVSVVSIEEIPMTYASVPAVRLAIKASGPFTPDPNT